MNVQYDSKDSLLEAGGKSLDPLDQVQYFTWGIFVVAYEVASGPLLSLPTWCTLQDHIKVFPAFVRFLKDVWRIAQWHSFKYYAYTVWLAFEPAFSLCLAAFVVFDVEWLFQGRGDREDIMNRIKIQVLAWLFCGIMSSHIEYIMLDLRAEIGGRLRAHFTPKLVQASLEWDLNNLEESSGCFPYPYDYGDFVPGWEFFEATFARLRHTVAFILQVLVMISVILLFDDRFSADVLSALMVLFFMTKLCTPKNRAGGRGYTFWTTNKEYNRLMVLFNIVFDHTYRFTLVKDGLTDYFADEYKTVSESLGSVKADTNILGFGLPPHWFSDLSQYLILNYPMALCALSIPWATSRSIIAAMVIFQYAISTMHRRIEFLKYAQQASDFLSIFKRVQTFYKILDNVPDAHGPLEYPFNPDTTGCKVTVSNVSYNYGRSKTPAVSNVSLTIESGQFIVIAGKNGSGKTSLLKLLTGLMQPSEGNIFIDDAKLEAPSATNFRKAVTFVTQSEAIYPVSLRENLLLGLTNEADRALVKDEHLNEAIRLGGATKLIDRRGYNAVLNPVTIASESIEDPAGQAAVDARDFRSPNPVGIPFSTGEHQRFIASRAFLRIKRSKIRLIILDEPSNALDPQAESQVFQEFLDLAKTNGQTLIVVTHRLASIARDADLILCMDEGKVGEQGTHDELVKLGGLYSTLYNAQAPSGPI